MANEDRANIEQGEGVPTLAELRLKLEQVTKELGEFSIFLADARSSYLTDKFADLTSILNARASVESKRQSEAFLGTDILKVVLISYFEDISKNKTQLANNLSQISSYFQGFPYKDAYVNLAEITWECTNTNASCMNVEANPQQWRLVSSKSSSAGKTRQIPLYIIAPNAQRLTLPIFGIPMDTISTRPIRQPD